MVCEPDPVPLGDNRAVFDCEAVAVLDAAAENDGHEAKALRVALQLDETVLELEALCEGHDAVGDADEDAERDAHDALADVVGDADGVVIAEAVEDVDGQLAEGEDDPDFDAVGDEVELVPAVIHEALAVIDDNAVRDAELVACVEVEGAAVTKLEVGVAEGTPDDEDEPRSDADAVPLADGVAAAVAVAPCGDAEGVGDTDTVVELEAVAVFDAEAVNERDSTGETAGEAEEVAVSVRACAPAARSSARTARWRARSPIGSASRLRSCSPSLRPFLFPECVLAGNQ